MRRYAVLIDLASARIGVEMVKKACADIEREGSIEYMKFYNYSTKSNREFAGFIKENSADVDLPMASRKKVRIDMRQVIDAVRIASTCDNINSFFIICSEVDGIYLINELKKQGKYVVIAVTSSNSLSAKSHKEYILNREYEVVNEINGSNIDNKSIPDIDNPEPEWIDKVEKYSDGMPEENAINNSSCDKDIDNGAYNDGYIADETDNNVVKSESVLKDNKTKNVKGDESSVFPYSDIDSLEIDEKMKEIDRKIIEMINAKKRETTSNINQISDNDFTDEYLEELMKKHLG